MSNRYPTTPVYDTSVSLENQSHVSSCAKMRSDEPHFTACTCFRTPSSVTPRVANVERRTGSQAATRNVGVLSVGFDFQAYQNGGTTRPTWHDFNDYDSDPYVTYSEGGGYTERRACPFCSDGDVEKFSKTLLWWQNSGHWECVACGERRRPFERASDDVADALQRLEQYVRQNRTRIHQGERKVLRAIIASWREQRTITDASASSHALAHATGVPQPVVWRILRKLVRCGVLERTYTGKQGSGKECAARFTLRTDGLAAPYSDPVAKRYEHVAFDGRYVHTTASQKNAVSDDTSVTYPSDVATNTESPESPFECEDSGEADSVEELEEPSDRFGVALLGYRRTVRRDGDDETRRKRANLYNRLRMNGKLLDEFGALLPEHRHLQDIHERAEAKHTRDRAAREAIEHESLLVPQAATIVRAVTIEELTAPTGRCELDCCDSVEGTQANHTSRRHTGDFNTCGRCHDRPW